MSRCHPPFGASPDRGPGRSRRAPPREDACAGWRVAARAARPRRNPPSGWATSSSSACANARACRPPRCRARRRDGRSHRQAGEGLIVEIEPRVAHLPSRSTTDSTVPSARRNRAENPARVARRRARPVPAKPSGFAIGEGLPRDAARAMRPRQRLAVEINRLVEPAIDAIAPTSHHNGSAIEQPIAKRRRLRSNMVHASRYNLAAALRRDVGVGRSVSSPEQPASSECTSLIASWRRAMMCLGSRQSQSPTTIPSLKAARVAALKTSFTGSGSRRNGTRRP